MINAMCDLRIGLFQHLEIMSELDLYLRIKYTDQIPTNPAPKKFRQVLLACKDIARGLAGKQCTLREANNETMEQFWAWTKLYSVGSGGYTVIGADRCKNFEKDLWFKIGKSMCKNHCC